MKAFFERFGSMTGSYDRQPGKKENQYWLNFTKTNRGGKQAGKAHKNDSVVSRRVKERGYDRAGEKCQEQ